jgi:hypothetical protein
MKEGYQPSYEVAHPGDEVLDIRQELRNEAVCAEIEDAIAEMDNLWEERQ